jgi:hypothetical protein
VAIFQHSLPFLQSESFQTHVGTIYRRAIGPLAQHNGTSAHSPSLACHLPAPTMECLHHPSYKVTCSSRQSVALRITSNLYSFSDHRIHSHAFCLDCCLQASTSLLYGQVCFIVALSGNPNMSQYFNGVPCLM